MQLEQWSHYWRSGSLTSLPQDFSENYDGRIKDHWHKQLEQFEEQSKTLDVCTGNGAIAVLTQQYSDNNNKHFDVHATDGASINVKSLCASYPQLAASYEKINFHSGMLFEQLDLEQSSFDLITSQYGIEYTDWQASASNIAKLLKTGGKLCLICHAPNTDITKYMKLEQQEYQYIQQLGFFDDIKSYLENGIVFSKFVSKVKKNNKHLKQKFKFNKSPLIKGLLGFYTHTLNCNEFQFASEREHLSKFYFDHLHAFKRLSDILLVSDRLAKNPNWYNAFIENNLALISKEDIYQNEQHLAGIAYTFEKK